MVFTFDLSKGSFNNLVFGFFVLVLFEILLLVLWLFDVHFKHSRSLCFFNNLDSSINLDFLFLRSKNFFLYKFHLVPKRCLLTALKFFYFKLFELVFEFVQLDIEFDGFLNVTHFAVFEHNLVHEKLPLCFLSS